MAIEGAPPLPQDVTAEILSRLPVKSLLRFKSVSKNWFSLIQNSDFVSLHLHRSTTTNDCLLVKRFLTDDVRDSVLSTLPPNERTPVCDLLDVSSTTGASVWDLDLLASCNGIVCLAGKERRHAAAIALCNPLMREIRLLPQPRYHARYASFLGFGFDPVTKDYKVVRVATLFELDIKPYEFPDNPYDAAAVGIVQDMPVDVKVEIYNLSSDCWREIDDPVVPGEYQCKRHPNFCASLNGVSYCFASPWDHHQPRDEVIIGFRMSNELFEQIPLPHEVCSQSWFNINLFTLNDALAFVTIPYLWVPYPASEGAGFDVWVMDGYGVEGSWNKKYTIGPFSEGYLYPLLSRQNGEFLLLRCGERRMVSYDLNTGVITEYQVYDVPGSEYCVRGLQVLPYTESLVPVKRQTH
ncbi:F-box protein CPR1-like [Rhododendron vialii]|uniref:F-box protein CPR1-like n=1 Tax=Rhododendron vialii TaxID=182163 RepID=UPI00265F06F7|nr:F-box protein CPR1-like [Rhododendron vialii]